MMKFWIFTPPPLPCEKPGGFLVANFFHIYPRNMALNLSPPETSENFTFFTFITWSHSLRIYPYPMVWPLPRPWPETLVSTPLRAQKTLEIKGFLGLERPILDLVSQTPRPRGRGRPLLADGTSSGGDFA